MNKTLDFFSGESQLTAPDTTFTSASNIPEYASTAAFVSAKGASAEAGDIFLNTTDGEVQFFDGTNWVSVTGLKSNAEAADPDADNDVDEGYLPGSIWINTSTDYVWVCVDNTDGAAVWNQVPKMSDISAGTMYAKYSWTVSQGTNGGAATTGSWAQSALNTEDSDSFSIGSIASDQVTLNVGSEARTVVVKARKVFIGTTDTRIRVRNVSDTAYGVGSNTYAKPTGSDGVGGGVCEATYVIQYSGSKIFDIQYYAATSGGSVGQGEALNVSGETETYAELEFWVF